MTGQSCRDQRKNQITHIGLFTFDGSKQLEDSGAGVVLTSPRGDKFCYVLRLMFPCTNNAAELSFNISRVRCFGDSDLVAQQVSGTWDAKDPLMAAYRWEVDVIAGHFKGYQVEHIDQCKNEAADALSRWGLSVNRCRPIFS